MKLLDPNLFLEINKKNFSFFLGDKDESNNLNIIYKLDIPIQGIDENGFFNFEKSFNIIKENIYLIEQKFNYTFKEILIILDNFNLEYVNLAGFKNLNGSQILKENIYYILNTIKSYVDEIETKKTILHIFNSRFLLDKKELENLPVGLFGDFYSHELSFILFKNNDYNNLKRIFEKCNLKIKKIFINSFIEGAYLSENSLKTKNFFHVQINEQNTKLLYFENNSLKFEQKFNFGSDIVLRDISKITSLKKQNIEKILSEIPLKKDFYEDELLEEKYFIESNYTKIKKKLIYDIANARVQEISERVLFKNINLGYYLKKIKINILTGNKNPQFEHLKDLFKLHFSLKGEFDVDILEDLPKDELLRKTFEIANYGWEKEAIPLTHNKKTILARIFDLFFN